MIQRQQTLWLLLSAVCTVLSFNLPFFQNVRENLAATGGSSADLTAGSNFFLLILSVISLLLAVITIFLYKDRKLQLRLCAAGIGIAVLLIVLYFLEMKKLGGSVPSLTSLIVFAMLAGYIMAFRGVWKDQKLVKSLDKLR